MFSKGALWFVQGDDKSGKHRDKYRPVRHAPSAGFGEPIHFFISGANIFHSRCTLQKGPCVRRQEEVRANGGSDDNSYEERQMMNRVCAIISVPHPAIGAVHIRVIGEGRGRKVSREVGLVKEFLESFEVEGICRPICIAIVCNGIVKCDGGRLDRLLRAEGRGTCQGGRPINVPFAKMAPRVENWDCVGSASRSRPRFWSREELDFKDPECCAEGVDDKGLTSSFVRIVEEGDEGLVSDFENWEERAIREDWSSRGCGVYGCRYICKECSEEVRGGGIGIPVWKAMEDGIAVMDNCLDKGNKSFITTIRTVSQRIIFL